MAPDRPARRHPIIGFLIRRRTIWISEFLANIIVGLLLILLMSVTILYSVKTQEVRRVDRRIAAIRAENTGTENALNACHRELHVLTLLRRFAGGRVTDATLCKVAALVCASSERFGYDPLLLIAVIHVESIFDPAAKGRYQSGDESGAIGLMQLQFETASSVAKQLNIQHINRGDLLKPDLNLMLGVAYLTQLITQFKSFKLGLVAYNQGPGAVQQTLSSGGTLTLDYYKLVLKSYYDLRKLAGEIDREVEGKK
jgi:hypothetical protein